MDAMASQGRRAKILLELRPALDRHAGIPQQTRLLFRGLSLVEGITVEGLIQSSMNALGKGLPVNAVSEKMLPTHQRIDRLARIVIMLEQRFLRSRISFIPALLRRIVGASESLSLFDATRFRDFIWRRLFARSLPPTDFDTVTSAGFRVVKTPWTAMHICRAITRFVGISAFPRLDTRDFDVMISETPYPGSVSSNTRLVVRYHDAIPLLMPHTISDRRHHQAFHYRALRQNVRDGAWFVCVSEATRKDLLSVFPEVESRSVTIHNIVSHDYFYEDSSSSRVPHVIAARLNPAVRQGSEESVRSMVLGHEMLPNSQYLLMVSTIEPRKNHLSLLAAWERLRANSYPNLKLVLVGHLGWHQKGTVSKFRPWLRRGEVYFLSDVPSPELRLLYRHARVTVCPSFAEGFDLTGIEAMMAGGVVVASDLPAHREVFADAAEYFNPYSVDQMTATIEAVIDSAGAHRRQELVRRGAEVARKYTYEAVLPQWSQFLMSLVAAEPRRVQEEAELKTDTLTDAIDKEA